MKKLLAVLLALIMVMALPMTAFADEHEPATLTILWGKNTNDIGMEDTIDEYMAEAYPWITIEWDCVDWGSEFQPKMQQYMQSGLPDIMIGKAQDVATYGNLGLLGEIPAEYSSRVLDAANENVTVDGKVEGLVYSCLYQGVYYNRTMFAENGWEVPNTLDELQAIIDDCNAKGIVPFASHMIDIWSIGNVTMQYMMGEVFSRNPVWGDDFRAGKTSFATDENAQQAYKYNELVFKNTFPETFSLEQTECDARMVLGEAAMKVSGSWSIQNFMDIDDTFDFGIFPFPNTTGDSKLIFEPNVTVMINGSSENTDAINAFLDVMSGNKDLAVEYCDFSSSASMLKGVSPTFPNPSQSDIDKYAEEGRICDVTVGNNQLIWAFQEENARDIAAWLIGDATFEDALAASDARVALSSTAN